MDAQFRSRVLEQVHHPTTLLEWQYLQDKVKQERDRSFHLLAIIDRAIKITREERLSRIMSLPNTIDWDDVFDNSGVVLVNLSYSRDQITRECSKMLGIMFLHMLWSAALSRKIRPKNHCFVYVDEFWQFISEDFVEALKRSRKRGIHWFLSTQDVSDLKRLDDGAFINSILNSCGVKIAMRMSNKEEARYLANEIFAREIDVHKIKYQGTDIVWDPVPVSDLLGSSSHVDSVSFGPPGRDPQLSTSDTRSLSESWHTEYVKREVERDPIYYTIEEQIEVFAQKIMLLSDFQGYATLGNKVLPFTAPLPESKELPNYYILPKLREALLHNHDRRRGLFTEDDADILIEEQIKNILLPSSDIDIPQWE